MLNKVKEIFAGKQSNSEKTVTVQISGMSCQSCVRKIDKALKEIPSVNKVTISLEKKLATIVLSRQENIEHLVNVITKLGYHVDKIVE